MTGATPSPVLWERDQELSQLERALERTLAGDGRLLLVEGAAGIGKSALLEQLRRRAEWAGATVLSARASTLEIPFAYGVVRQLFESRVAGGERERLLSGAAATAAAIFDPVTEPERGPAADTGFAMLHGLFWLTLDLARERPLVLLVDDLHWCDRASLRFLVYLSHRLEGLPILVAAGLRSGEPGVDPGAVDALVTTSGTDVVRPRSLSAAATSALVFDRLGAPAEEFVLAAHRATGGNPLLLGQVLAALRADGIAPDAGSSPLLRRVGPRAVLRTVRARVGQLGPEARELTRALAVLGEADDLRLVAGLARVPEATADAAVGALVRAEILHDGLPLRFVHPLVRDAVYDEQSATTRASMHAAAAAALRDAGASIEQVAVHLLAAPGHNESWVVGALREAGGAAVRRGAPDSAALYLRRALAGASDAAGRPRLAFDLGMVELMVNVGEAPGHLRDAAATLEDPQLQFAATMGLVQALIFNGAPDEAAAVARDARSMAPPELDDARCALETLERFTAFFGTSVPRVKDPGAARAHGGHVGGRMLQVVTAFDWALASGSADQCSELTLEALDDGALMRGDPGMITICAITVLAMAGRAEAHEILGRVESEAHRVGSLFGVSSFNLWRGFWSFMEGQLDEALVQVRLAVEQLDLYGAAGPSRLYEQAFLAMILTEQGDLDAAAAAFGAPPAGRSEAARLWWRARCELLLALGRYEEALQGARALGRDRMHIRNPAWLPWRTLEAQALVGIGHREQALDLVDEELVDARTWGAPATVGRTLRIRGELRGAAGVSDLAAAVELLEGSSARLECTKALDALGRANGPELARGIDRRAYALASDAGAAGLARRLEVRIVDGHRAVLRPMTGVSALTRAERRVVDLAAAGHGNRHIAQTLFVTPKTVEAQLSSAYRKLGIRSRRELSVALAA